MKDLLETIDSEIEKRNITQNQISEILQKNKDMVSRRIIGGYSTVAITDREGQKIPISALKRAVPKFMANLYFRPVCVFHCLAPETPVLIQNSNRGKRYVPISEINAGDKVFTHTGKTQRVLQVIVHENNGPALSLTLDNNEIITVTGEHPILAKRGWIRAKELTTSDILLKLEHPNRLKGKTLEEIYGKEGAERFLEKISKPKLHYTLTEKHNSQKRKGKTWNEVYGHNKPNYGGSAGEKNPMYGQVGRITGEKNPNWCNGKSFEIYPKAFSFELKEMIRANANYKCEICGIHPIGRLLIHHKDFDKKNCSLDNLQALCRVCHRSLHNKHFAEVRKQKVLVLHNGTKILKIENIWYTGKVYNLEVDVDHTYTGKGIIYHNSDVVVGRVLPQWTNPDTGEVIKTEVTDIGWYTVCEIRDDIEIANKVWDEILKGNLRSFSIAGSSINKVQATENGQGYEKINELSLYETTLCSLGVNSEAKFSVLWDPKRINAF